MKKDTCAKDQACERVLLPMAPFTADEAASLAPPRPDQPFVKDMIDSPSGSIPKVSSSLTWRDRLGIIKARLGVNRMHYTIDPGLYALGEPDTNSPVLVTANYKMSFDYLRDALPGKNAWILVLDTKGINVWCAAGKGTFGTDELVRRIAACNLKSVVSHRDIILPQLGAPGVAAHLVRKLTGFRVHYGPVSAQNLPAYLDAGMKATPEMRRKDFPLTERIVLIPIELIEALKGILIAILALLAITGLSGSSGFIQGITTDGLFIIIALLGAVVAGAVLHPILLPYLPGRAFATKGFTIGVLFAIALTLLWGFDLHSLQGVLWAGSWILMISGISGFLAMNFTGASTYTSLSGVKKEMRWALPLEIGSGLSGFIVWLFSRFAF